MKQLPGLIAVAALGVAAGIGLLLLKSASSQVNKPTPYQYFQIAYADRINLPSQVTTTNPRLSVTLDPGTYEIKGVACYETHDGAQSFEYHNDIGEGPDIETAPAGGSTNATHLHFPANVGECRQVGSRRVSVRSTTAYHLRFFSRIVAGDSECRYRVLTPPGAGECGQTYYGSISSSPVSSGTRQPDEKDDHRGLVISN